jgi:hypothetical protein
MAPRPLITSFAFRQVVRELDRVAPNEGILVPLVSLTPRDPEMNPCAPIRLEAIANVLIAAVVLVPRERQVNQGTRVSVRAETDDVVNEKIERLVRRFPRLRACAHLHSHPFARGRTWPSSGARCDYDGHMLPQLETNTEAGLRTSFSFIACHTLDGRGWLLQCFALDERKQIVDLGFTEVLADDKPIVLRALTPALTSRPVAHSILRHWLAETRRRGLHAAADELFDGWQRLVVRLDADRTLVALVPIGFPQEPPRYYLVDHHSGRTARHRPIAGMTALPAVVDELGLTTTGGRSCCGRPLRSSGGSPRGNPPPLAVLRGRPLAGRAT